MGIARSTCYDAPKRAADDTALVEAMHAIKDDFEAYGWRHLSGRYRACFALLERGCRRLSASRAGL
jgi:putative transposase